MALPSSGQISMRDIRTALGSLATNFSLMNASKGNIVAINSNSEKKPRQTPPYAFSDWHGYNHSATGISLIEVDLFFAKDEKSVCDGKPDKSYYVDASPWTSAEFIYTDAAGTNPADDGWYQRDGFARPVSNGVLGKGDFCI